jgi:excisionase family DNA binding protein
VSAPARNGDRPLALAIPDEVVERIAERAAEMLADRLAADGEPWIGVDHAAEHLACSRKRIYDLVAQRRVPVRRDGRRLLFRRSELDAALEEGP